MNQRQNHKPLYGKIVLKGRIMCITGLHIGASKDNLDIGGLDAPVMRDPITREPYLPGSSLKGKLRALFERKEDMEFNRAGGQDVWRHECVEPTCKVCRVFGATGGREGDNMPARLIVRDCHLTDESLEILKKIDTGLQYTEWKFENSLDRITAAANPRQLERIPAGSEFSFEIVYNVENKDQVEDDLTNVLETLSLLEDDYLGGHGSRGYGKISFEIESFSARKIEYYAATSDEVREKVSVSPPVSSIADCKQSTEKLTSAFEEE